MTLYEKRGRRYYPVQDTEAMEGLPGGSWLVIVSDGRRTCRRLVEPDHAGFLAAARAAEDAMIAALAEKSAREPRERPSTPREREAAEAVREILGDEIFWLSRASARDIAEAGVAAVRREWERVREGKGAKPCRS